VQTTTKAEISLVLITCVWGTSFLVVKDTLSLTNPYWLLLLRFSAATALVLLIFRRSLANIDRSMAWKGLLLGFVLYLGFLFQTTGLEYTTPAKSAFITGVNVILVPLFGIFVFRSRVTLDVVLGVSTAFVGIFLLTRPDELDRINRGDVLTLLCAVVFAVQILLVERYSRQLPTSLLTVLQLAGTAAWTVPLAALHQGPVLLGSGWQLSLAIGYLAAFCTALAFFVQIHAQKHVSAARAALIFSLEPVFAAIASTLFYGERLSSLEWLGGFLVVAGVIVGELSVLRSKTGTAG